MVKVCGAETHAKIEYAGASGAHERDPLSFILLTYSRCTMLCKL